MKRYMDTGSMLVAAVTLVLFVAALFAKGLSHDLFLEAGIFLVSVKIILMNYRNNVAVTALHEKLDRVLAGLAEKDK